MNAIRSGAGRRAAGNLRLRREYFCQDEAARAARATLPPPAGALAGWRLPAPGRAT